MNFAAFFSYVLLTTITPGPNNIMSMSNAAKYGLRRALPFNVGVFLGFVLVAGSCAAFTALLYDLIPSITPVIIVIGAAYILWLAWSVWRDKPHAGGGRTGTNTVTSGAVLQLVNVKVILFSLTAMSSFILPHYRDFLPVAGFAVLLALSGFCCTICWAVFGAVFERLFKAHAKILNAVMALLLVYCAAAMLMELIPKQV